MEIITSNLGLVSTCIFGALSLYITNKINTSERETRTKLYREVNKIRQEDFLRLKEDFQRQLETCKQECDKKIEDLRKSEKEQNEKIDKNYETIMSTLSELKVDIQTIKVNMEKN